MSWAKRNLYFLISGIVAIVLLGAAGWYCYSSWQSNNTNWDQLNQDYATLNNIVNKPIGAGNENINNIDAAREETKEAQDRVAVARKFFLPIPGIPNTNRLDDRTLAFAVRETVAQLRVSAAQHNVALPVVPSGFAFSFSLQEEKAVYDSQSLNQLSKQLGEIKAICDTLFSCRVASLDSIQRERTSDDINPGQSGGQPDYVDSVAVTNGNIVIAPYQVTFRCFTPELGAVLSSFANQSHTVVVKTLAIEPEDIGPMNEGAMPPPTTPVYAMRGGLPVVIDEKKLRVTMLLDLVKTLPQQGR
jgi:hypothetical protein